jgi:uncharacterized membrane protein YcaP (DUF421 family)
MFLDSLSALGRTLVLGAGTYAALVVLLRVSGKRTLAKMNAFDLVVTVALGSTLSSAVISRDVSLAQAALAIAVLLALQVLISWLAVRVPPVRRIVKAEPTRVFHAGTFLDDAMRRERVLEEDVLQAVRSAGYSRLADVGAVVIETDGTFSVTPPAPEPSALRNVA